MVDIGKAASSKKKAPREKKGIKKGQKLIVKLPIKKNKQILLTQPPPNITLAMLKQGQKKMDRAMTGPIGSQRTPDNQPSVFPGIKVPVHHIPRSSLFTKVAGFSPLQDPDKKNKNGKYQCRYCPAEFRVKKK